MNHDWLLVETLGNEPVVVAQGRRMKNLVPVAAFLRRSPHLAAVQTAIAETIATGDSLASITPKGNRVIRTEPIVMMDGRIHGVQVWVGPIDAEPPERPLPGPLKWDLTSGLVTDTPQSLINAGMDPETEPSSGRMFADDFPTRSLNFDEAKVLALAINAEPGQTYCDTWDYTDKQGRLRQVGFVARSALETVEDGSEHLIGRAMNIEGELDESAVPAGQLAQRILDGLSQPGVYRALVDLKNWNLYKWLDEPCPNYNWRAPVRTHPADQHLLEEMTEEFATGPTARVLRLPALDGSWVPMHVAVNRIEVDDGVFAGLVTLRKPTDNELTDAGLTRP